MEEQELLAKTQMALGKTFPWVDEHGIAMCLHCGVKNNYQMIKELHPKYLHNPTCIYLIALLAIGDYE